MGVERLLRVGGEICICVVRAVSGKMNGIEVDEACCVEAEDCESIADEIRLEEVSSSDMRGVDTSHQA